MDSYNAPRIEVQIEGNRCRVVKNIGGTKREGDWIDLPIHESDLNIAANPASDLAIAVAAHDQLGNNQVSLHKLLTEVAHYRKR
jgi:hypothetical protein